MAWLGWARQGRARFKDRGKRNKGVVVWYELNEKSPKKNGTYLCDFESHYAILNFKKGKWLPNDSGAISRLNDKSSYTEYLKEMCAWTYLPRSTSPPEIETGKDCIINEY